MAYAELGDYEQANADLEEALDLGLASADERKVKFVQGLLFASEQISDSAVMKIPTPTPTPVSVSGVSGELPATISDESGKTMVLVPAGEFSMGIEADKALEECQKFDEEPAATTSQMRNPLSIVGCVKD